MCDEMSYTASVGFLKSPNYPEKYPGGKNCSCTLVPMIGEYVSVSVLDITLQNTFACLDWLEIDEGTTSTRICGVGYGEYTSFLEMKLSFYASEKRGKPSANTQKGFWLNFQGG